MGLRWAEHTIEIAATPEEVFDAITDYETFPEWQSAVLGTEVIERQNPAGLGELVKYEVDGKIRTIRYTLRYHYERPGKISWDFLEGEGINKMDGGYELRQSATGTSATYAVGIDVSGIPGPILKRTHRAAIKKANQDLKTEAERRAAGSTARSGADLEPEVVERGEPEVVERENRRPTAAPPAATSDHPFDELPGPLGELAKLPGRIMVRVGRRLGG
ncbi:MAG: SRPBCC family protein [Solirubrobacterales bacterium]